MIRVVLALWLAAFPALAAVEVQQVTSPGGIRAWLVEERSIPFVALEIRFRGGTSLDLPGKRGATNLMVGLLEEGAGDMDARAFAQAAEELAARFGFSAGRDSIGVSARFLTENRDDAVALLRLALLEPRFDQDALDRVRAQVLTGIRARATDPDSLAGERFNHVAFGDHPYGSSDGGTSDSVGALARQDMLAAHERSFARDRLYIGAAGDITADELASILDRLFGALPDEGPPLPAPAGYGLTGGVDVIGFDSPQSVAIFGQRGIARDDRDFFAAFVMNHVLGGSRFGSRLTGEVREKRGLTYGISTYLSSSDDAELLIGQVASANDTIAEAIGIVQAEWARMATHGVTDAELAQAKTYLTGAYPLRFDGNARIAGILVGMQMTGLTPDYITTRNDRVEAVTVDDIRRVARRLLDPEGLYFVVVGRPEGLDSAAPD